MAETLEKKHERIMLRFDRAYSPQQEVREKCIEATRFARVPGGQWEGATAAGTKLDEQFEKYPKFEINKVATELNRIIAEYRNNRITVKFRPGDREASEELANKLNGLFRADYEETDGGEACDNAFDDAATGGFGCFRLTSMLVNEYDPMDDRQRIAIEPIYDPSRSVWFDPDAKKYDKSDALWAFCMYSLSPEKYEAEYGKKPPASLDVTSMTSWEYDWFDADVIYIAKYYEVRKESVDVISYRHPITGEIATYDSDQVEDIEDELAIAGFQEVARRSVKRRRVYVSVVDGDGFLEKPRRIPGEHIPLIPVYGKRWFIDDIERVEGHIAKAMDPQRLYNLQVSMLADTAAQDPGQIPIVGMEQIRGLEKHWEARNKKRPAFLPLREVRDKSGNIIAGATPAGYTQPAVMNQALAALLQQTSADIQEVTGGSQAMQQMPSNIAQETVNNLMNRADMASFIYLDNIDGEGLDDFKEYNRNQLLISGIAKPRNEKEQQIVQQAQMAAQSQPNPEMVLAQAQMVAAQAEAQKATNETAQTQIKAFTAQQDAMESQANTVYKLAQARNIDDKAVMEAIRLLKDVAESQQQQFQSPPQSPADLMPS
ncbi:portal protein [Escherichia albertii]